MPRYALLALGSLLVAFSLVSASAEEEMSIFDGRTLQGWTTLDGKPVTKGWEVVDGVIHLDTSAGRSGNIVTDREYGDFELEFEWKIAERGNSGIKYRVRQYGNRVLGCEFQILDDASHPQLRGKGSTGSLYAVYEPIPDMKLNPAGEFNHSRIIVHGNRIEHWLNGDQIMVAWVGSAEWHRRIGESKFSDVEGFGQNRFGKIMLTDHGSEVWYKNLTLTPLPPVEPAWAATPARCRPLRQIFIGRFRRCR
jgi:hypothetical protein